MNQRSAGHAASVLGTVLGLAVLLAGEAYSQQAMIVGGGVIALAAVGLLVALVMTEPEPDGAGAGGH